MYQDNYLSWGNEFPGDAYDVNGGAGFLISNSHLEAGSGDRCENAGPTTGSDSEKGLRKFFVTQEFAASSGFTTSDISPATKEVPCVTSWPTK